MVEGELDKSNYRCPRRQRVEIQRLLADPLFGIGPLDDFSVQTLLCGWLPFGEGFCWMHGKNRVGCSLMSGL